MKIDEKECTTIEELLNDKHVTPVSGFVDVYTIIDDYIDFRVDCYAVYDGDNFKLINSMEEVVSYCSKLK